MIIQILWLGCSYLLTGLIGNAKPARRKRNNRITSAKSQLVAILIGLGGVMTMDWLSEGDPLWPALGLITGVAGALFPIGGSSERGFQKGLAVYWGGVFYLKPVSALIGFSIALEGLIWSKDRILTAFLFNSILPVLFSYSQVNPYFIWAAVVNELLFALKFKDEIRTKFREFFKSQKTGHELDKI